MRMKTIEICVGMFVLAGFAALVFLAVQVSGVNLEYDKGEQYKIYAEFGNVSGLSAKAKVMIAGVLVGRVKDIQINKANKKAKVMILMNKDVDYLPIDTIASIQTAGILGEKYIALSLGGEEDVLKEGDKITDTQSSLILEELIGKFLSSTMSKQN